MSSIDNPLVSVAILTWNRRQHVVKAINSVLNQSYHSVEIVVVDSASTDGTGEIIRKQFPDVKYIRLHRNLGCPEGRNVALANCNGDIIYALDDDGWLAADTLQICVDRFRKHPRAGVIACRILAPAEDQKTDEPDALHYVFSGGAAAIRREVLERVGYYPSDFFRQAEEGDLALRILDADYEILQCPKAVMFHESSPINRNDKLFFYYNVRNELYTVIRHYPYRYIPAAILQKLTTWGYAGIKQRASLYMGKAVLSVLFQFPRLIRDRKPVSSDVVRMVWATKGQMRYMALKSAAAGIKTRIASNAD